MRSRARLIGLLAGPLLALLVFVLLPHQYVDAQGQIVPLGNGARTTAGVAVWMALQQCPHSGHVVALYKCLTFFLQVTDHFLVDCASNG